MKDMSHIRYTPMNPNFQLFLDRKIDYAYYLLKPKNKDDRNNAYYTKSVIFDNQYFNFKNSKWRTFIPILILSLFLSLLLLFNFRSDEQKSKQRFRDLGYNDFNSEAPSIHLSLENLKSSLDDYINSINKSESYPTNVNKIQPHHIRVIGAIGDSLTIGSRASDFLEAGYDTYPHNTFFAGGSQSIHDHLTIYNIFDYIAERVGGYSLYGASESKQRSGLNFAVSGKKSDDLIYQVEDLISAIKNNSEINFDEDWKLISLWIGTNDVGTFGRRMEPPISAKEYKNNIEKALIILKDNLPRTIVSIIGMFQPELLIEALEIMEKGHVSDNIRHNNLKNLCDEYRNALFEIQNDPNLRSNDFSIVVQPFATQYDTPYKNKSGEYDQLFYAFDKFHTGKFGNAIIAKHLWKNLFEPVGLKTTKADLADVSPEIYKIDKSNSFIRTVGNS